MKIGLACLGVLLIGPSLSAQTLQWDHEGAAYYTVSIDTQFTSIVEGTAREAVLPPLELGDHLIFVSACNADSVCTPSPVLNYTVPEAPPPPPLKTCTDLKGNVFPVSDAAVVIPIRLRGNVALIETAEYRGMVAGGWTYDGLKHNRGNLYDATFRCQL